MCSNLLGMTSGDDNEFFMSPDFEGATKVGLQDRGGKMHMGTAKESGLERPISWE